MTNEDNLRLKIGKKVSFVTILVNLVLAVIKLIIGVLSQSSAIIADGIHSTSDIFTTVGVIIGLKLSTKEADAKHPYGHERIESISSFVLGIVLLLLGLYIGFTGFQKIYLGNISAPKGYAIYAAILSIIIKEWMYHYTIKYAKLINSTSLRADAWHHRSDSLSSIGALIGVIAAINGYPIFDSIASIIICLIIIKVAFDILKESISQLIDESANEEIIKEIQYKINSLDNVKHLDNLKTRIYANKIYVDVEVSVDPTLSVEEGHDIAAFIHSSIEENPQIKHCMVHVNPWQIKKSR